MVKKGKKSKSKEESKEKLVTTSPIVDSDNSKVDSLNIDADDEFDKLLQEFIDSEQSDSDESSSDSDDDDSVAEDDDNAPTSPIVNCPQFAKIVNTLLDYDWETDFKALDKNILHFSKDNEQYVLYLYYGTETEKEWLADEENFQGIVPLWFSECSHTLSPVYSAKKYADEINETLEDYHQPIVVLMHPNRVINAEDIVEQWDDTLVVSIDRFCSIIESEENLEEVETAINDVGRYPDLKKSYDSVENKFSKRALEQIEESQQSSTTEEIYNDGIDIDAADFNEIEIERVRFGIDADDNNEDAVLPSIATYFRYVTNAILMLWIDIKGEPLSRARYSIEIRDAKDKLIVSEITSFSKGAQKHICLDLSSLSAGDYWLYIKHNGSELYCEELIFVDVEKGYEKYLDLEAFGLYRADISDLKGDHISMMQRGMQSCFNYDSFAGVLVTPQFKNIGGKKLQYQFILTIKNEQGRVVYEGEDSGTLDPDEQYLFASEVRGVVCPTGNYTITVKFLDETLLVTDFTVGHRDVKASFRVDQIRARSGRKSRANTKVADPMKELDSMVGLGDLKTQLRKHIAKIEMDQLRQAQGLPPKAQQLHMAFLGNPGTGKTTVAKLLGQIYKEIGVLSKGHVVLEDRSTLMTQNWGGEGEMVNKALEKAQGGILFIDEAYDLVTEHKTDPGKLIISALLQALSDESNRDFMVIFAGYTLPMERLLSKNPGLRSRCKAMYFKDYKVPELMQIADLWLGKNCYKLTADARKYFESIVSSAYASRDENFGNARYVVNLLENEVQPTMAERVMAFDKVHQSTSLSMLTTIEACDIPNYVAIQAGATEAIAKLDNMVGLGELKRQIRSYLSLIRFVQSRRENKIDTPIPPLHMVFTGNPGTGKTSVAEYLGDIYRSIGLLSIGNVIKVTRADMIDSAIGGTEAKMKELINAAHGNILFIDEAYTLFSKGEKDYGKNAIEVLLDTLGKESIDMIVIMAGYPKEMEELLGINPGLKGRFPHTFHFEDYNEDELFEIAEGVAKRNSLTLTKGAKDALKAMIRKECKIKDSNFSNARFVVRLITTQVLPNMAMRLEGETDPSKLKRILQRDIPIEYKEIRMINENLFDEEMIESALERLDSMVGLTKVKVAIHQFVDFARNVNRKDPTQIERYPLKWSFVGNTGTGKSSVAEVLSAILKAMHLLGKGHTIEVKAEELYGVATYKADELLQQRMRESLQGLLFVDGDAPQFRAANSNYNPDHLRMTLAANTAEIHGRFAVVIAEQDSPKVGLAKSLNKIGISNFDHTLIFDDYTAEELMAILTQQLAGYDLNLSPDAATIMYNYIIRLCADDKSGGDANARTMKELARTIRNIVSANGCENQIIHVETVEKFSTIQSPRRTKIGY